MKRFISVALALVMIFALAATFSAEVSPVAKDYYDITVSYVPSDGSLGVGSSDKSRVEADNPENVTLTADTKNNGKFIKWVIEGDYDIVSGSLTDPVIVIKPKSDIHATAYFEAPGSTPDTSSSKSSGSDSKSSPKTGDPLWIVLGLAVLALGAGALAVKKIKE